MTVIIYLISATCRELRNRAARRPRRPGPSVEAGDVIVPGQCASACLDALDVFKQFPNTKLIGAPSSADATYMEVRLEELPSGLAVVVVPTKLYVNRPRGNGEGYQPDIQVQDVAWSTAAFRRVVERDLEQAR